MINNKDIVIIIEAMIDEAIMQFVNQSFEVNQLKVFQLNKAQYSAVHLGKCFKNYALLHPNIQHIGLNTSRHDLYRVQL
ncbi:MAG TPA: hypothetical protein VIG45_03855 [Erysipelothrix sp.]